METRFIEHLVANRSEYDELREIVSELGGKSCAKMEKLFDRLIDRIALPEYLEEYAYAYVFLNYDPLPEN